jgi:hypothetical protein
MEYMIDTLPTRLLPNGLFIQTKRKNQNGVCPWFIMQSHYFCRKQKILFAISELNIHKGM